MIKLPEEFKVTEATAVESHEILAEPHLIKHLDVKDASELSDYILKHKHTFHILKYKRYKMLFFFYALKDKKEVVEFHVACPKDSVVASRVLLLAAGTWVIKKGAADSKVLISSCPEGKIANTARKLGGIEITRIGSIIYFSFPLLFNDRFTLGV